MYTCSRSMISLQAHIKTIGDPRGRDRMVGGYTTTRAISVYHH